MKSQKYKSVQILGPFNSGTNLMARIMRFGISTDINMKTAGGTHICKHTIKQHVLEEQVRKHKDTLFICMYRPMAYWIESIKNNMYDLVWDKDVSKPCLFRDVKYDSIYHLHKTYYDNYQAICDKFPNVISVEYNLLINKDISFQYLTNKFIHTNIELKPKQKLISILEKPTKNPNKEFGKNCDQAFSHLQTLKNSGLENQYLFSPDTKKFFELGI
jgi:hypothetical protein